MKVEISRMYIGKDIPKKDIKFMYDKTSENRPAWIWIENLPKDIVHISVRVNGEKKFYRIYLSPKIVSLATYGILV